MIKQALATAFSASERADPSGKNTMVYPCVQDRTVAGHVVRARQQDKQLGVFQNAKLLLYMIKQQSRVRYKCEG